MFQPNAIRVARSLTITNPPSYYTVGAQITASFSVRNNSNDPVTLDKVVIGGRVDGQCPNNVCPDIGPAIVNKILQPWETYDFQGTLKISQAGTYSFFAAYQLAGIWNVNMLGDPGVTTSTTITAFTYCPATPAKATFAAQAMTVLAGAATCAPAPAPAPTLSAVNTSQMVGGR